MVEENHEQEQASPVNSQPSSNEGTVEQMKPEEKKEEKSSEVSSQPQN